MIIRDDNMLNNGYCLGIKSEHEDLSSSFEKILDSNPTFLIAGSFSFWLPPQLWTKLSQLTCPKLILLPFKYKYTNQSDLTFEIKKIQLLINSNTAVLINSLNHSKFILTDSNCFVGSNNLTSGGIINNIENCIIMSDSNIYYTDWYNEILTLIRNELTNFSSLTNTKSKESKLAGLTMPIIKDRMSNEEVITSINQLKTIYSALISVSDCYQHLENSFEKLVKDTKKSIQLFNSPETLLTKYFINNLTTQYNEKKEKPEIWIRDCNSINNKLTDLSNSLNKLSSQRKVLMDVYKSTWKQHQLIYDKINDSYSNRNLINLNKVRKHLKL